MTYEELPDVIRSVVPKNKFASARRVSGTRIVVRCNYNDEVDLWVLRGGRWTFHNPAHKSQS